MSKKYETAYFVDDRFEQQPPEENIRYEQYRNGCFLYKKITNLYEAWVPANLDFLKNRQTGCQWIGPKIPANLIYQAEDFFIELHQKNLEGLLIIYYSAEKGYLLDAPLQENSTVNVRSLEPIGHKDEYLPIGTAHSHPGKAFFSDIDQGSEAQSDGLHIVFGDLNRFPPTIICCLVINKIRFDLPANDVLDLPPFPPAWREKVKPANHTIINKTLSLCGIRRK
jgi:hypothetical protein